MQTILYQNIFITVSHV